jgi:hypothetical protein
MVASASPHVCNRTDFIPNNKNEANRHFLGSYPSQLHTQGLVNSFAAAFDTANHEILFALLKKFGVPTTLVEPIRKLHRDFTLKFKLGMKEVLIDYSTGVKQGDNITPALFLFLMRHGRASVWKQNICMTRKKPVLFQTPPKCNKRQNQMSITPNWHQREGFLLHSHSLC